MPSQDAPPMYPPRKTERGYLFPNSSPELDIFKFLNTYHTSDKWYHICRFDLSLFKLWVRGLPWWRSGWESACQCRGHGFEPWSGRIPRAAERLGPWATIPEPARLEPVLRNKRGAMVRGPRTAMKSGPHLPQLERALAQKRRPNTAIDK